MKGLRWILPAGPLLFAAIQLVGVDRTNPPVRMRVDAPDSVLSVVRRACYDCHSNETRWPWYSHVAPMSWLLAHHVKEGRKDLNFSEWPVFDEESLALTFGDIRKQVGKKAMPLRGYAWLHRDARLTEAERRMLIAWAEENRTSPPDPR